MELETSLDRVSRMRNLSWSGPLIHCALLGTLLSLGGCGGGVDSEGQARQAYAGLDKSIGKALQLGFDGFNAASSANITPQVAAGDISGTLTVGGQVDQGASDNKGMRLVVAMVNYSDGASLPADEEPVDIVYHTASDAALLPALTLSLKNIPNGTLTGTLVGSFQMEGDLKGEVTLNLTFSGAIESNGAGGTRRKEGTTSIVGTATSGGDTFDVNVTR